MGLQGESDLSTDHAIFFIVEEIYQESMWERLLKKYGIHPGKHRQRIRHLHNQET